MKNLSEKKITLATLKSFVKNNRGQLFLNLKSRFNGMIDGIDYNKGSQFEEITETGRNAENTLNINGVWLVGCSRDYLRYFVNEQYEGIEVSNACGSFILAVKNN